MWNDLTRPVVVAHRGDRAFAPENTIAAFNQAAEKGAAAIEFDVKLTSDRQVIVLHDQTVDRTTTGKGNVSRLTLAAIKDMDANVQFPDQFPGEKIPTLTEVFEAVGRKLFMNIELTNYATPGDSLVREVVQLVKKHALRDRVLFSSFFACNLRKSADLLPAVPRGLLTWSGWLGLWGRTFGWHGDFVALHPFFTDLTFRLVERVHAAGKSVNVWTVNEEKDLKIMIGWGVDGIITDDPAKALRVLGNSA